MKCKEILPEDRRSLSRRLLRWSGITWGCLQAGMEKEVKRIYVALDATEEVIEAAIRKGADLLGHTSPYDLCAAKEDHRCRIYREPSDPADQE